MIHALVLSLGLAIAPQGDPIHASLHPAAADLYLEFSDVAGLWKAYEQAPVVQFLRDERISGFLSGLGVQIDPSPQALAKTALASAMPGADSWLDGLKSFSLSLTVPGSQAEGEAPYLLQAVADFAEPAQADALKAALLARAPHEPLTAPLPGVERLMLGDSPADQPWIVSIGPRLIAGGGSAKVDDFAARSENKGPGFAGKTPASFSKSSGTTVLWFHLSRPLLEILQSAEQESGDIAIDFLEQLPSEWNPVGSARTGRMQMVGDRFVTEMLSAEKGAVPGKPIETSWLEPVPSGAMLVYSTAIDGEALGKQMRALAAKDEQQGAALAAIEQKLGFGPERVLARLGPALTVYAMPVTGLGLPETRVWVDCADPAAFQADLEALLNALGEIQPGFAAKSRPYKVKNEKTQEKTEVPVVSITLPPGMADLGPMFSIAPSFSPVGKKLIFALSQLAVKDELKRVYGAEGEPITPGANPLAARGFALPEGALSVVLMDWGKLFAGLMNVAKSMGPLIGDALPFDVAKLPPGEVFTQYLKPTFHYSKPVEGGRYRRNEASFGAETWLGVVGGALMTLGQRASMQIPTSPAPEPTNGGSGG